MYAYDQTPGSRRTRSSDPKVEIENAKNETVAEESLKTDLELP